MHPVAKLVKSFGGQGNAAESLDDFRYTFWGEQEEIESVPFLKHFVKQSLAAFESFWSQGNRLGLADRVANHILFMQSSKYIPVMSLP